MLSRGGGEATVVGDADNREATRVRAGTEGTGLQLAVQLCCGLKTALHFEDNRNNFTNHNFLRSTPIVQSFLVNHGYPGSPTHDQMWGVQVTSTKQHHVCLIELQETSLL